MAEQVRERLLMSAVRLGQRDGWSRLTVADVLEQSGAARRSLYTHFPAGTSDLTVAAVRLAADWITSLVDRACEQPSEVALSSFIEHWTAMLVGSDFLLGCPVAAAGASRTHHPEAAAAADTAFTQWEMSIASAMTRDGAATSDAQGLAVVIVAAVEGAVTRCVAARSIEPMEAVHNHLQAALRAALPRPIDEPISLRTTS